jgi:transcriptional regulator with XRE-family HTH domain
MRRLRAARGLSQEALAHECGINRTYLSAVERAERNVSIDNIARVAKGLKVEPWRFDFRPRLISGRVRGAECPVITGFCPVGGRAGFD